ncbi:MAG: diguanylate cyclase [Candidatus Omnitrophica bacterium]|nr:diguanylate cyclase [Candidatus Omnitrophota bacterium]
MCAYFAGDPELNLLNPESQKIFRDLIENIKVGVFMADSHSNLFYVNHAFNETFNFPNHNHATGKNWIALLFPDPKICADFQAKFQLNGFVIDFETTCVNSSGQKYSLMVTVNHIYNDKGSIIGVRGVTVDISEHHKLEEQLSIRQQKLEKILDFYNRLSDIMVLHELNDSIVQQVAQILGAGRCSIMYINSSGDELSIKASYGISEEFVRDSSVKIGTPVAGLIALKSQSIIVDNIEYHEQFKRQNRKSYSSRSFMSAPLMYNQKLIGIINVSERQGPFTPTDLKVLETIAKQAAINICKLQLLNNFEYLSQTDSMTGLYNYRAFIQKLEEEISRFSRYGHEFSLMMVDVDNFKTFNDQYGHMSGDKLLKRLADMFKNNLRSFEHVCRYGGDEFAIILPNTDSSKSAIVGEKLCDKVRKEFAQDKISLSIGVAEFQANSNKETLIQQADQALYQAKESGRNTVRIFK